MARRVLLSHELLTCFRETAPPFEFGFLSSVLIRHGLPANHGPGRIEADPSCEEWEEIVRLAFVFAGGGRNWVRCALVYAATGPYQSSKRQKTSPSVRSAACAA